MCGRGFTLVELLVTVVVSVLLLSLALPSFHNLVAGQRSAAAINQMVGAVNTARSLAITGGRVVTLCPGRGGECLGRNQWHQGMLIFVDHNGNGRLDGSERVAQALPPLSPGERLYWRSFRNRSYLQFQPRGYTQWQNGNFLYCPPDLQPEQARMAILNAQGRLRTARDVNGNGVVEDAGGRDVRCPP
jgi:type IV fimbrial biogenesis protein FimT